MLHCHVNQLRKCQIDHSTLEPQDNYEWDDEPPMNSDATPETSPPANSQQSQPPSEDTVIEPVIIR
jgi:hypothetical protein